MLVEEVNLAFAFTNLRCNALKGTCLFQNMVIWTACHQHAEATGPVIPALDSLSYYFYMYSGGCNKSFLMSYLQSGWSSHLMRWVSWNMGPLFVQRILVVSSSWVTWWRRSQSPASASWKVIYYLRKHHLYNHIVEYTDLAYNNYWSARSNTSTPNNVSDAEPAKSNKRGSKFLRQMQLICWTS